MEAADKFLTEALSNQYVSTALTLTLAMYAGFARPQMPKFLADLFENSYFRLFILFMVVYMSSRNAMLAVMVAVAFTITMKMLNEQKLFEMFRGRRGRRDTSCQGGCRTALRNCVRGCRGKRNCISTCRRENRDCRQNC